jgi:RNA polymerase sigma factor (sigma-70 family)
VAGSGGRDRVSADPRRTLDALWRIEGARVVATLAKFTGDIALAEDLAQSALVEALQSWTEKGVPHNAGAWLTAVAKRRAIDEWRRRARLDERHRAIANDLAAATEDAWEPIDDDVLRLVFTACHPVLSRESQVALTLRVVGGLTTEEIARMLLVPVTTVQARITRAKKTLSAAQVPFRTPEPAEWSARLAAVLGVVYLIFTEGYAATSGERWIRHELADEALRLGRMVAVLTPREPEAHALVALMELQASRFAARTARDGSPVLLADQDRTRWDHSQIQRGVAALERADVAARSRGSARGPYALQAAIAQCHAPAVCRRRIGRASWCCTRHWEESTRIPWSNSIAPSPCRWRRARRTRCPWWKLSRRGGCSRTRICCRASGANCSPGSAAAAKPASSCSPQPS